MLILMIDNKHPRALQVTLELYGFDVEFCRDVDSAMGYVCQNATSISSILLDIMMPNGKLFEGIDTRGGKDTGLHLYQKIREVYSGPIIFLTVVRDEELVMSFIGSDSRVAYLTRPQEPAEIVKTIYQLCGKGGNSELQKPEGKSNEKS